MGGLDDFLALYRMVAVLAVPAVPLAAQVSITATKVEEPQEPQEPQGGLAVLRAHMLDLADDENAETAHIHRLNGDDVAVCVGEFDETLRTYIRGLERGARMDEGMAPFDWTTTAHCAGCGPVWWHCAEQLKACPWCFKRKGGKSLPSPPVRCGDCRHYEPDRLNPAAGTGHCRQGAGRGRWPMQLHSCSDMRPVESMAKCGNLLMISVSKKSQR